MVKYQGEQIRVRPVTLVCENLHHQLYYLPEGTENKSWTKHKCIHCDSNAKWYYVSTSTGNWLRLLDDKKLQQIEQDAEKVTQDEYLKKESEKEALEKSNQEALDEEVRQAELLEKEVQEKKKQEEKEQLKKEKAEKQKEARELQKRLKALETETGPIEITNTGEIPEE